jgi:predicted ATPase/DNA-binding SARP family transcriptional activator
VTHLTIRLFGYPQFLAENIPIKVERRKTLALLAYLALETGPNNRGVSSQIGATQGGCSRDALATFLWPGYSQEQASAYLRQAIWDFSKAAGEGWIIRGKQTVSLNPQSDIWVDVNEFESLLVKWKFGVEEESDSISILNQLVALYQYDFLAGFTLRDSPAFDDWQVIQTESLRLHLGQALEALTRLYFKQGEFEIAAAHVRRWLALDPFNEAAHRMLMRLYDEAGQRNAALRQYESCQRQLRDELGVVPEVETVTLYERIRDGLSAPAQPRVAFADLVEKPAPGGKRFKSLPTGTVTFLFTDIEGSTQLWEHHPEAMQRAFSRQESIVREAMAAHEGYVYKMVGDAFQVAFSTAPVALAAAIAAQRVLAAEPWGEIGSLTVRMALHTGVTEERDDDYVGPALNRAARLLDAGHGGQVLLSQSTYELVRDHLPEGVSLRDLGEWRLKDLFQLEHIYQVVASGLPGKFPPIKTVDAPTIHLPQQVTPFVGREVELAKLEAMLENPDCRLISLVGIGGSGKTRLAIQAARQCRTFPYGIYFVGLADITSLDGTITVIAEVLQMTFHAPIESGLSMETAQAQLLEFLAEKKALLVLDNFEQLIGYADFLSVLLDAAPEIKLIVTSRERLNLPGEWVLDVSGLSFPGSQELETIPKYAAVQLFLKGAERTSHFTASTSDWPAIARICQLVEGIPLGVEMAAAWTKMLSCQEIATEIEGDLDFLTATWRGMPERHRTLRAVFDHSWRLLSDNERDVFCRLSVFRGAFSRQASLEIAGATLSLLASLGDKSFIRRVSSGCFEIHPVLKQYVAEKLAADPTIYNEVKSRHARYYMERLYQMNEKLKGSEQVAALNSLRSEAQNLRDAWHWLIEQRDFEQLRRVLPALILFYVMNDQRVETQDVTQWLLDLVDSLRPGTGDFSASESDKVPESSYAGLLALTLAAIRHFRLDIEHLEWSNPFQQESLQWIQRLPDGQEKAFALLLNSIGPGILLPEQSLELGVQTVDLFRRLGNVWAVALAQLVLGDTANFRGLNAGLARASYQASLEAFSQLGNQWGRAMCLTGLVFLEHRAGHLEEAYQLGSQSLEIFDQMSNYERMLDVRYIMGEITEEWGRLDEARSYFEANCAYFAHRGVNQRVKYYRERLASLGKNAGQVPPAGG